MLFRSLVTPSRSTSAYLQSIEHLLGPEHVVELPAMVASDDFSKYGLPGRHHYGGEPIPYCYWFFGGHSKERYDAAPGDTTIAKLPHLPSNHQSNFAPDPESTLRGGVSALTSWSISLRSSRRSYVRVPNGKDKSRANSKVL